MFRLIRKKQSSESKETFEEFVSKRSADACPLCNSMNLKILFDDYVECGQCKHIFTKAEQEPVEADKPLTSCPVCGIKDYNILFEDSVECKNCKHIYKLK